MKFLAIDYGAKRLGIALSDPEGRFAFPHQTYNRRTNDVRGDLAHLLALVRTHEVEGVVFGVPSGSSGSDQTAGAARRLSEKLQNLCTDNNLNIEFFEQDERFSTQVVARGLRESGISEKSARERGLYDAGAAAELLQAFLDQRQLKISSEYADS